MRPAGELFGLDRERVLETYGEREAEIVLSDGASEQMRDVLRRPDEYAAILRDICWHLTE